MIKGKKYCIGLEIYLSFPFQIPIREWDADQSPRGQHKGLVGKVAKSEYTPRRCRSTTVYE